MRACRACGTKNPDDARYCLHCGVALAEPCPNCGVDLPGEVRFCPSCGTPIVERAEAGEERKLVTLLFADVTGSTSLGDNRDPEQFREIMGGFFSAMRREIEAEGGTVEKFIGDAVMAAFGVPSAHEDDPSRALRAALRMRSALARLNERYQRDHRLTLAMRVGVNTGDVVAQTAPRPGEGLVSGDATNVAARLEQMAEPGQILVSARTARGVKGFDLRSRGLLTLRGKAEPVRAFELIGDRAVARESRIQETPFVGRSREIALLQSVFERVLSERRPHLVTIYGDAGVGKSRLVREVEQRLIGVAPTTGTVSGRCLPYGQGVTYWPLAQILKREAGVLDSDSPTTAIERIEALVRQMVPPELCEDPMRAAAALAFTVGLEHPDAPFSTMEPRQVAADMFSAWRAYFSALAAKRPTVVVVEDVHWAEPAMLELLEGLAERAEGPLLFLCPARPELTARRPDWGGGMGNLSSVVLESLPPADASRLLDHLAPDALLGPARDRILERTQGNPFFVEEVVRRLQEEPDEAARAAAGQAVEIPDTVQAVITARIDLLGVLEKRVLRAAAVVGRDFWVGAVRAVTEFDPDRLDAALGRLEDRGLVQARLRSWLEGEREYTFRHILTRDVAYGSLPRRERADAHAAVAGWIERTIGDRGRELAALLAHHFGEAATGVATDPGRSSEEAAELSRKAFGYALTASIEMRTRLVLETAVRMANVAWVHARSDAERSLAREALGLALYQDARGDEAWRALKEAVELHVAAGRPDEDALVRQALAAVDVATRGRGTMHTWLQRSEVEPILSIVEDVGPRDDVERVRLLTVRAFWPDSFPDRRLDDRSLEQTTKAGEAAAQLAESIGRLDLASAALDAVGSALQLRAKFGAMYPIVERRLRMARALDDPWEIGDAFAVAAWSVYEVGRYRDAFAFGDEGFGRAEEGAPTMALHCLAWRALARFRLADWDGVLADRELADGLLGDRGEGPPSFGADQVAAAAFIHEAREDPVSADRCLELLKWLEGAAEQPWPGWAAWRAMVLARRGLFGEAWATLSRPYFADRPYAASSLLEASAVIVAEQSSTDPSAWLQAPSVIDDIRSHARASGVLALPLIGDRLEGRAAWAAGDHERAVSLLTRSSAGLVDLDARWDAAVADLWLAEAQRANGDVEASALAAERALAVFERVGAVREADRGRAVLSR